MCLSVNMSCKKKKKNENQVNKCTSVDSKEASASSDVPKPYLHRGEIYLGSRGFK